MSLKGTSPARNMIAAPMKEGIASLIPLGRQTIKRMVMKKIVKVSVMSLLIILRLPQCLRNLKRFLSDGFCFFFRPFFNRLEQRIEDQPGWNEYKNGNSEHFYYPPVLSLPYSSFCRFYFLLNTVIQGLAGGFLSLFFSLSPFLSS